ncbi:PIN domain-containing protein [Trichormus azollae]|jgi:hypothetical protein|uniref:PIN domain-containing protein n=1 Tax=Nostoc azollae (strain 0708) TaxID=551115 RepID=D7DWN2_NOSA0|nr:PIN domain-containing protein [Trichormus azollae]ADI65695.1 conserved hypothetical protein ['Nostoc azollae' 0708]
MKDFINDLIRRYSQKGSLIDTNILFLLLVGSVNKERMTKFHRTQQFIPEDYELLLKLMSEVKNLVTTPNILTEINSLANQFGKPERSECFAIFAVFVQNVHILNENYIKTQEAVSADKLIKFGLTHSVILTLAQGNYLVLTGELKLENYLHNVEVDVINFNNILVLNW